MDLHLTSEVAIALFTCLSGLLAYLTYLHKQRDREKTPTVAVTNNIDTAPQVSVTSQAGNVPPPAEGVRRLPAGVQGSIDAVRPEPCEDGPDP